VPERLVLIAGPTAAGKSDLALALAERLGAEILSIDATAVYRGLDVGSAKPDAEARRRVAHHGLDLADPWETYTLGRFLGDARRALARIEASGRPAVLVGGSGLYARALAEGWEPPPPPPPEVRAAVRQRLATEGAPSLWRELARRSPSEAAAIHPTDTTRVARALERLATGGVRNGRRSGLGLVDRLEAYVLDVERAELARRIEARARRQYATGLLEETLAVLRRGVAPTASALRSIGYREATAWALGRLSRDEALARTVAATLALAKRQRTWWRHVAWVEHLTRAEAQRRLLA
jgi:tRNA dimethylallyltransferase